MTEQARRGPPPAEKPVGKEKKETVPTTRVKSGGRTNRRIEDLTNLYKRKNPGKSVRWVYDPQHKPDLSNLLSRQVDGFRLVLVKDLGEELALPGMKPDEPVRVGDTVMMSVDEAETRKMRAELDKAAADEMTRVEQEFSSAIEEITATKSGKTYSPRPLGRSVMEEVEREVEGPETHKE